MPLPVLSRKYGVRDDYVDANLTALNSASVTTDTFTSNGDFLNWNVTMTNPSNGDFAVIYRPVTGPDPSVFSASTLRYYDALWPLGNGGLDFGTNFQLRPYIAYTPSPTIDSGQTTLPLFTAGQLGVNFPLTLGKQLVNNTISQIGFEILCVNGRAGVFNFQLSLDFVYVYKELMTLPAIRQPIVLTKRRNVVEIPILQREGGQVQDMGSVTEEVTLGGHLVSTTSGVGQWTNTYTADQWWYLLNGLVLEAGTIQADGFQTWQWFQSDQIQGKYIPTDVTPQQPMGRVQYWDYVMRLKKFNILGETIVNDLLGPGQLNY